MGFDIERNALKLPCPSHNERELAPRAPDCRPCSFSPEPVLAAKLGLPGGLGWFAQGLEDLAALAPHSQAAVLGCPCGQGMSSRAPPGAHPSSAPRRGLLSQVPHYLPGRGCSHVPGFPLQAHYSWHPRFSNTPCWAMSLSTSGWRGETRPNFLHCVLIPALQGEPGAPGLCPLQLWARPHPWTSLSHPRRSRSPGSREVEAAW